MDQNIAEKKARLNQIKLRIAKLRKVYVKEGFEGSEEQITMDALEKDIDKALVTIEEQKNKEIAPNTNNSYLESLQDLKTRIATFMNLHNIQ